MTTKGIDAKSEQRKPKMSNIKLTRDNPPPAKDEVSVPLPVSAGPVEKVIDYSFNPSRDKIREVTVIDRMQGRLFPQLDMINLMTRYCLEVAFYRQDPVAYAEVFGRDMPIQPDPMDEFLFRTAQWQKSVAGKNLDQALNIALAEVESRATEGEGMGSVEPWDDK